MLESHRSSGDREDGGKVSRRISVVAVVLLGISLGGQTVLKTPSRKLYLLAATPDVKTPYPVTLYTVEENKRLDLARQVVDQVAGADKSYAAGNAVFFTYPSESPTSVAIVHMDDPTRTDNVVFRSGDAIGSPAADLAEPPGRGLELLLSWITTPIVPGQPLPTHFDVTSVSIPIDPSERGRRLQTDRWADYTYLRLDGEHGGPNAGEDEVAFPQAGKLVLRDFNHPVAIAALPPALKNLTSETFLPVFASTDRYLLFSVGLTQPTNSASTNVYALKRVRNEWNTIQVEGNSPILRLFGDWLAEIVETRSPNHAPIPGRENERTWDEQTSTLPPVQRLYENTAAHPGILILQNLVDGRKIRIETDQEDSEILWADEGSVLYRMNDLIYKARIVGQKLEDTTMIVQDEDVPEIHWAFWLK